jgi:nucleotide-binding universal stress UspA family protein
MHIARIVVPTDFGEHAEQAVKVAATFAVAFGAKLTLLHIVHLPEYAYDQRTAQSLDDLLPRAQDALDQAVARARSHCSDVEGVLAQGRPWESILRFARERGADLIVMGTHGRRGVPRALLGSVAEKVLRSSPVPVVVVFLQDEATPATA